MRYLLGRVTKTDDDTTVEMLGAPTINDMVGCPTALERLRRWASIDIKNSESVAEVANTLFSVDLSGRVEAEIISGIFTELEMP